jgi:hypothetical protein
MTWAYPVTIFAVTYLDIRKGFADGHKMETNAVLHATTKYQLN